MPPEFYGLIVVFGGLFFIFSFSLLMGWIAERQKYWEDRNKKCPNCKKIMQFHIDPPRYEKRRWLEFWTCGDYRNRCYDSRTFRERMEW